MVSISISLLALDAILILMSWRYLKVEIIKTREDEKESISD